MGNPTKLDLPISAEKLRTKRVQRVLWIVLFLNLFVCICKLGYGYWTQTLGMVADGYHSLFDSTSNLIALIAIQYASKPADRGHPYGHSKAETLATLVIAVMLFGACYEIGSGAYERLQHKVVPDVTIISFIIMIGTMIINFGVSHFEKKKGEELGSQVLIADATQTRSDILVSASVILALIGIKLGYVWLDPIAAAVIAVFVAVAGIRIIRDCFGTIMDEAKLDPATVRNIAMSVAGVSDCHEIRSRGLPSAVYVDLNIHVDPSMSVDGAHELTHQVITKIKEKFPEVVDVVVHTEPDTPDHH